MLCIRGVNKYNRYETRKLDLMYRLSVKQFHGAAGTEMRKIIVSRDDMTQNSSVGQNLLLRCVAEPCMVRLIWCWLLATGNVYGEHGCYFLLVLLLILLLLLWFSYLLLLLLLKPRVFGRSVPSVIERSNTDVQTPKRKKGAMENIGRSVSETPVVARNRTCTLWSATPSVDALTTSHDRYRQQGGKARFERS